MIFAANEMLRSESLGLVADLMRGSTKGQVGLDVDAVKLLTFWQHLNEPHRDTVAFALCSNLSVIHGPPGTGKTTTLVEIVCQLVKLGERVLVCGPSNTSVDNVVERLTQVMPTNEVNDLLRLGHPARLSPGVRKHSYDILAKHSHDEAVFNVLESLSLSLSEQQID